MILAATTANATLYETPMGYIDSETNMIHFTTGVSAGESGPVLGETRIIGGIYNPVTRLPIGEPVILDPADYITMRTLGESDWQVVGRGEDAADQWRIATQNMNNGMNGNIWITIGANADRSSIDVWGRTIDVAAFQQNITAINPDNQRIVNQEATRLAVEQAYHAEFGTVIESTGDANTYNFNSGNTRIVNDIYSQAAAAHVAGYDGTGLTVTTNIRSLADVGRIAPGATRAFHMNDNGVPLNVDIATVTNSSDTITFDASNSRRNAQNAAGTALICDKFETVNGSNLTEHVNMNMDDDGLINISDALSPTDWVR